MMFDREEFKRRIAAIEKLSDQVSVARWLEQQGVEPIIAAEIVAVEYAALHRQPPSE